MPLHVKSPSDGSPHVMGPGVGSAPGSEGGGTIIGGLGKGRGGGLIGRGGGRQAGYQATSNTGWRPPALWIWVHGDEPGRRVHGVPGVIRARVRPVRRISRYALVSTGYSGRTPVPRARTDSGCSSPPRVRVGRTAPPASVSCALLAPDMFSSRHCAQGGRASHAPRARRARARHRSRPTKNARGTARAAHGRARAFRGVGVDVVSSADARLHRRARRERGCSSSSSSNSFARCRVSSIPRPRSVGLVGVAGVGSRET